jgi:hypothetical protein
MPTYFWTPAPSKQVVELADACCEDCSMFVPRCIKRPLCELPSKPGTMFTWVPSAWGKCLVLQGGRVNRKMKACALFATVNHGNKARDEEVGI